MEQTHDLLSNDLQITPATENQLNETAKWGKFLAIVGFIFCGIMVVFAFLAGAYFSRLGSYSSSYASGLSTTLTVTYLVVAAIMFIPFLFLYKFSVKMQKALKGVMQEELDSSFQNLKAMFRFQGIVCIIGLVFFILGLLGLIVGKGM